MPCRKKKQTGAFHLHNKTRAVEIYSETLKPQKKMTHLG